MTRVDRLYDEVDKLEKVAKSAAEDPAKLVALAVAQRRLAAFANPGEALRILSESRQNLLSAMEATPADARAEVLLELGRTEYALYLPSSAAVRTYAAWRRAPTDPRILGERIRERGLRTGNWKAAAESLTAMTRDGEAARSADVWHLLALSRLNASDASGAEAAARRAIELEADHYAATSCLAAALLALGRGEESLAAFSGGTQASQVDAMEGINLSASLLAEGRFGDAAVVARRGLEIDFRIPAVWNNYGNALFKSGYPDEAVRAYEFILHLVPNYADVHRNLALCLSDAGRNEQAIESFKQFLTLEPDSAVAMYELAGALDQAGRHDEAEASYLEALRRAPRDPRPRNNLGLMLAEMERFEESIRWIEEAIDLEPGNAARVVNLAIVQERGGRLEDAIESAQQAVALAPDNWSHLRLLAGLLSRGDRANAARRAWLNLAERARSKLAVNERDAGAIRALINALLNVGETDQALLEIDSRQKSQPAWAELPMLRADCLRIAGRPADAIREVTRVIELGEESGYYQWRGWLHFEQGEDAAAVADLRKAIALDPANVYAAMFLSLVVGDQDSTRAGKECLAAAMSEVAPDSWPERLLRYLSGDFPATELLRFADSQEKRCEANFYIGERVRQSEGPAAARGWYQRCIESTVQNYLEYKAAVWRQKSDGI